MLDVRFMEEVALVQRGLDLNIHNVRPPPGGKSIGPVSSYNIPLCIGAEWQSFNTSTVLQNFHYGVFICTLGARLDGWHMSDLTLHVTRCSLASCRVYASWSMSIRNAPGLSLKGLVRLLVGSRNPLVRPKFILLPPTNLPPAFSPFHSTPHTNFFVPNELPKHPDPALVVWQICIELLRNLMQYGQATPGYRRKVMMLIV